MKIGAKTPPIHMRNHFFPLVRVEADPKYTATEYLNKVFGSDFKVDVQVGEYNQADGVYPVMLTIEDCEAEGVVRAYTVKLAAVGYFAIDSTVPEDTRQRMAAINGGSILYGAAREYLLYITSRGPYPAVYLPTVSLFAEEVTPDTVQPSPSKKSKPTTKPRKQANHKK